MKIKLRCYCCGKRVDDRFTLVGMRKDTDRVFVMRPDCAVAAEAEVKVEVQPVGRT